MTEKDGVIHLSTLDIIGWVCVLFLFILTMWSLIDFVSTILVGTL